MKPVSKPAETSTGQALTVLPPNSGGSLAEVLSAEDPITGTKWKTTNFQPFSFFWVFFSLVIFVLLQVLFGWFTGTYLLAHYTTAHTQFLLTGMINLSSYYVGGFLVGVVSPKVRVLEPAVGAFLAIVACLTTGWFVPTSFVGMSFVKLFCAGAMTFVLAWLGALHGEKLTRQL